MPLSGNAQWHFGCQPPALRLRTGLYTDSVLEDTRSLKICGGEAQAQSRASETQFRYS